VASSSREELLAALGAEGLSVLAPKCNFSQTRGSVRGTRLTGPTSTGGALKISNLYSYPVTGPCVLSMPGGTQIARMASDAYRDAMPARGRACRR